MHPCVNLPPHRALLSQSHLRLPIVPFCRALRTPSSCWACHLIHLRLRSSTARSLRPSTLRRCARRCSWQRQKVGGQRLQTFRRSIRTPGPDGWNAWLQGCWPAHCPNLQAHTAPMRAALSARASCSPICGASSHLTVGTGMACVATYRSMVCGTPYW